MNTITRFDLEQEILQCWQVVDDIRLIQEIVDDPETSPDRLGNCLIGMREMYQLKFEKLFRIYEQLVQSNKL